MDYLVAQLALIFLPGILWATADNKYVSGGQVGQFTTILKSFTFGLTTYGVLYVLYTVFGFEFSYGAFVGVSTNIDISDFYR
jgi:hypothetical protein